MSFPVETLDGEDVGRTVVRGGALRGLGFLATNLLGAAGALLVLRYLGVVDFGRFGTIIALLAIVQGISDAGLGITAVREMALRGEEAEQRSVLAHIVGARILLTTAGVGLAVGFVALAGYDDVLVQGTALAGFGVLLASTQQALVLPLSVRLQTGRVALNDVLRQVVLVAGFATLVLLDAPLLAFFGVQVLVGLVLLAAIPALLGRGGFVRPRFDTTELRRLAVTGLPIAVAAVIGVVYGRILVIVVSLMTDEEPTGLFVTSSRIYELAAGLPGLLLLIALPVLTVAARDDRARMEVAMQRMTEVMVLAGVAVALVIGVAAEPLLVGLGGEPYRPAAPVLRIQCLALVTLFLGAAWSGTLVGMGRARPLAQASGAGLVVVLVAGTALTAAFGVEGAAAATVLADLVLVLVLLGGLRRAGPGRELDLRVLPRLALAAAPAVAVGLIPGVSELVLAPVALAVLLGLALALRLVPPELLAAARRRPADRD